MLDFIGRGSSFGGRVIEDPQRFPGLPAPLVAQIRAVSSAAFVHGMHSAITVASFGMFAVSIVSFALIRDKRTETGVVPATETPAPDVPFPVAPQPVFAAVTTNGYSDYTGQAAPAYGLPFAMAPADGYATNGYGTNGYTGNGYAAYGYMPVGDTTDGPPAHHFFEAYQAPYDVASPPAAPWEPADNSNTATGFQPNATGFGSYPPAFYPAFPLPPAADPEPASPLAFAAHAWVPTEEPAPLAVAPPSTDATGTYQATPIITPVAPPPEMGESLRDAPMPLSANAPATADAVIPPDVHNAPDAEETPIPLAVTDNAMDDPTIEYDPALTDWHADAPTSVVAPSSEGAIMSVPPGIFVPPAGPSPAVVVMRDDALIARVATLEQFAHDSAARFHDDELDLLMRKVAVLEDAVMRFITEVPIRLGGEIGDLERRVAHLAEESEAFMNLEPEVSAETVEHLDEKVVALERFTKTMPPAQWHHEQDTRGKALERRVIELEQFCAALARRGTTPRAVVASTVSTTGETSAASGKTNGVAAASTTLGTSASRNSVSRHDAEEREGERRRRR